MTALVPVYSQTPTFSEWTFSDGEAHVISSVIDGADGWYFRLEDNSPSQPAFNSKEEAETSLVLNFPYSDITATRTRTDIIGYTLGSQTDKPIASTNDLARASAIPPVVTNIVRDLSLGGIWDSQLEVWWTPRMRNGSLTYEATTNVNLNAEN